MPPTLTLPPVILAAGPVGMDPPDAADPPRLFRPTRDLYLGMVFFIAPKCHREKLKFCSQELKCFH